MEFIVYEDKEPKDKNKKLIPAQLCKNLRMNLIGQSESGKTQFMFNILFNWCKDYYKKSKATIIFMTGTHDTALHVAELAKKNRYTPQYFKVYDYFDLVELEKLYREHDGNHPLVFVLDDVAFLADFSSPYKKNFLTELFSSGRHKNVSIIISLQKYFFLSEDCRSINATHLVIYNLNKKEFQRLYEENMSILMSEDEFRRIAKENLDEQYKFILFDKKKKKLYNSKLKEITFKKSNVL